MIELKRLKLINWHNFENVTFDCARLTYMIGVNAVGFQRIPAVMEPVWRADSVIWKIFMRRMKMRFTLTFL